MRLKDAPNDFPLKPPGIYECEVANIEKRDGEKGPFFNWTYEITSGLFDGGKLFDVTSLTKASLWKLKKVITALVPDENAVNFYLEMEVEGKRFEEVLKRLKGKRCRVYIEHAPSTKNPSKMIEDVKEVFPKVDPLRDIDLGDRDLEQPPVGNAEETEIPF